APLLTEQALPGDRETADRGDVGVLADSQQLHILRRAPGAGAGPVDAAPDLDQAGFGFRGDGQGRPLALSPGPPPPPSGRQFRPAGMTAAPGPQTCTVTESRCAPGAGWIRAAAGAA